MDYLAWPCALVTTLAASVKFSPLTKGFFKRLLFLFSLTRFLLSFKLPKISWVKGEYGHYLSLMSDSTVSAGDVFPPNRRWIHSQTGSRSGINGRLSSCHIHNPWCHASGLPIYCHSSISIWPAMHLGNGWGHMVLGIRMSFLLR